MNAKQIIQAAEIGSKCSTDPLVRCAYQVGFLRHSVFELCQVIEDQRRHLQIATEELQHLQRELT